MTEQTNEVSEVSGEKEQECPECGGSGAQRGTRLTHSPGCTSWECASDCPQPEQVIEPCDFCEATGVVDSE